MSISWIKLFFFVIRNCFKSLLLASELSSCLELCIKCAEYFILWLIYELPLHNLCSGNSLSRVSGDDARIELGFKFKQMWKVIKILLCYAIAGSIDNLPDFGLSACLPIWSIAQDFRLKIIVFISFIYLYFLKWKIEIHVMRFWLSILSTFTNISGAAWATKNETTNFYEWIVLNCPVANNNNNNKVNNNYKLFAIFANDFWHRQQSQCNIGRLTPK